MIIFLIIVFVFIALMANADRNKKKRRAMLSLNRNTSPSQSKSNQLPPLPEMLLKATTYFGNDWRAYLIKHHGKYELWPLDFFDIAANALQLLSLGEQKKLDECFNQNSPGANAYQKHADYTILHHMTLKLLREDRFSVLNMSTAYRTSINLSLEREKNKTVANIAQRPLPPIPDIKRYLSSVALVSTPVKSVTNTPKEYESKIHESSQFMRKERSLVTGSESYTEKNDHNSETHREKAYNEPNDEPEAKPEVVTDDVAIAKSINMIPSVIESSTVKAAMETNSQLTANYLDDDNGTEAKPEVATGNQSTAKSINMIPNVIVSSTATVGIENSSQLTPQDLNDDKGGVIEITEDFETIGYQDSEHAKIDHQINKENDIDDLDTLLDQLDIDGLFPINNNSTVAATSVQQIINATPLYNYDNDQYKFGKRYKVKMGLTATQVALLNKVSGVDNVFISVEGCCIQTIRVFLEVVKRLNKQLKKKETTIKAEIERLSELALSIHKKTGEASWYVYDGYGGGGQNYLRTRIEGDVYYCIFKRSENLVRSTWEHKRKVSGDFVPHLSGLPHAFEESIGYLVDEIVPKTVSIIEKPDLATEVELNKQNTTRWKNRLDQLKKTVDASTIEYFSSNVHQLFAENKLNPSRENIFFEASKIVAKKDKIEALRLYLHYLHADLLSDKIDDKQLGKTIQNGLFKSADHENSFLQIVQQLKLDRNIGAALTKVETIYAPIRKRITLNLDAIQAVKAEDRGTVELLNIYLQDDEESDKSKEHTEESKPIPPQEQTSTNSAVGSNDQTVLFAVSINDEQGKLISYFASADFLLRAEQLDAYCNSRGQRKSFLIESINETCFELLDDNLIEELDEETYEMNEDYYKTIISA